MKKSRFLALTLFLSGIVLAFPIWLFSSELGYTAAKATVSDTRVRGLLPKSKRRDAYLSDRQGEPYIYAKTDSEASSFALDIDCLLHTQNAEQKFSAYYATYPTRHEAEVAAAELKGKEIPMRYDPANIKVCRLEGAVQEDCSLLPIFIGLTAFCEVGAVLFFLRSVYKM